MNIYKFSKVDITTNKAFISGFLYIHIIFIITKILIVLR